MSPDLENNGLELHPIPYVDVLYLTLLVFTLYQDDRGLTRTLRG